jgi:hypothetical protein
VRYYLLQYSSHATRAILTTTYDAYMCCTILTVPVLIITTADPRSHRLWHAYGVSSDRLGLTSEALSALNSGLSIAPSNSYLLVAKVR